MSDRELEDFLDQGLPVTLKETNQLYQLVVSCLEDGGDPEALKETCLLIGARELEMRDSDTASSLPQLPRDKIKRQQCLLFGAVQKCLYDQDVGEDGETPLQRLSTRLSATYGEESYAMANLLLEAAETIARSTPGERIISEIDEDVKKLFGDVKKDIINEEFLSPDIEPFNIPVCHHGGKLVVKDDAALQKFANFGQLHLS